MPVTMRSITNVDPGTVSTRVELALCHPVDTATLFWPEQKLSQSFSYLKNRFNTATSLLPPDF